MKDNDSAKKISQELATVQIKWKLADSKRVRNKINMNTYNYSRQDQVSLINLMSSLAR